MANRRDGLTALQLHAILENVQDALIATDPKGFVLFMNDAAAHLYGFEERAGAELDNLDLQSYALETFELRTLEGEPVPEGDQPLTRALRGESYRDMELLVRHRDLDETRVFAFSGRLLDNGSPISVLTIRDETARWRAERRYRTVFEADPAPSLVARLEDAEILQANAGMQEMLGAEASDVVGSSISKLGLLTRNGDVPESIAVLRSGERLHKRKSTLRHPNEGKVVDVLVSARAIEIDGEPCGLFTFTDVTDLERSQRERIGALEELAHARSRLAEVRESERARIAQDLHDGVVQDLLALNTELAHKQHTFEDTGSVDAAEISRRSRERALDAVAQLRRAVRGLRPPALREMGLWPSIRESLPDLHHAADAEVVLPEGDGPDLPEEVLVVLHRVAREAIRNALKHANATKVRVTIRTTEREVVLGVHDDGDGFEVPERLAMLARHDHFGLLSMDERITAQGGRLEIDSAPGNGTEIRCRIPLDT